MYQREDVEDNPGIIATKKPINYLLMPTKTEHKIKEYPDWTSRFIKAREKTNELLLMISAEDACAQSMVDASPAKWHAAHTTWFFETFILKEFENTFTPYNAAFESLFNSYYNSIGEQFPRPNRGMITRPSLEIVKNYREQINNRITRLLNKQVDKNLWSLIELGIQHEEQHQELLVMDLKHLLSLNPTNPVFCVERVKSHAMGPTNWIKFDAQLKSFGHTESTFHFDNERPAHKRYLESYQLASRLVTNQDFLNFISEGGYDDPLLWLSDGWAWVKNENICCPLYWKKHEGQWREFTLSGLHALALDNPVCHVSFYEAAAYAAWANARLPTEFEWERASIKGHYTGDNIPVSFHPSSRQNKGDFNDLFGSVWQWTNSNYLPFPRYKIPSGAVGEYNGKFMSNQNVLKGSSCCTPSNHSRPTYRNYFYPQQRWAFSGLRLARDVE